MPRDCAALKPSTTAGNAAVPSLRKVPRATLAPRASSRLGSAAMTAMPPVSILPTAAVRRTVALGTKPTAVAVSTGGMRRIMPSAARGSDAGWPVNDVPALTLRRLPSAASWSSRPAREEAEMPSTATAAAMPIAIPRADRAARIGRARSPLPPSATASVARRWDLSLQAVTGPPAWAGHRGPPARRAGGPHAAWRRRRPGHASPPRWSCRPTTAREGARRWRRR